jgi:hypothetical protein
MQSMMCVRAAMAAGVVMSVCAGVQAASVFNAGSGNGSNFGEGRVRANNADLTLQNQTFANFSIQPGSPITVLNGSTSGGLGDGVAPVASISTSLQATISEGLLPGETRVRLVERSLGQFNSPNLYSGGISTFFELQSALTFTVDQASAMTVVGSGLFASVTGLQRVSGTPQFFANGSVVTPGTYALLGQGFLFGGPGYTARVSDTIPSLDRTSAIDVLLVVPAPGAAGLVLAGALAMGRRRR